MKDLEVSRLTVMAAIPEWSGKLVAYDITDLTAIAERTPMKVAEAGGIAYPVLVRPGSKRVAAHRFVVNPDVVHNGLQREFLLRHETENLGPGAEMSAEAADGLLVSETGPDNAGLTIAALQWAPGNG
ncbi:MAG: hypothetical protein JWN68_808 [Nocardioides sp.]|jgi:hypothetical protein|nr:hypothetical protein [Nocardioides sp.]